VFLFDKVLVVTRLSSQSGQQTFQVYRQPIPIDQLVITDLKDGEVKMGSFRSAFGSGQTGKLYFIPFAQPLKHLLFNSQDIFVSFSSNEYVLYFYLGINDYS
jgi:hypothetical protein